MTVLSPRLAHLHVNTAGCAVPSILGHRHFFPPFFCLICRPRPASLVSRQPRAIFGHAITVAQRCQVDQTGGLGYLPITGLTRPASMRDAAASYAALPCQASSSLHHLKRCITCKKPQPQTTEIQHLHSTTYSAPPVPPFNSRASFLSLIFHLLLHSLAPSYTHRGEAVKPEIERSK